MIAFVNAAIWTVVVPPFQVPDEISHFGYAQYLAETGKLPPQGSGAQYSPQEEVALGTLGFFTVIGNPELRGVLTPQENAHLRAALATHPSLVGGGGASAVTNQPPLYYALEAIPYWLSPSQDILARLELMRLLSALMAAGTVLAVFMFLREVFPVTRWTWTVGALMVAFQPTFAFIAAGVQGDNLLYLTSALTFLVLMRTYRRGLTTRRAVGIGAVASAGALSKLTFVALVPGIVAAVLLLGWRARANGRSEAIRRVLIALLVAAVPITAYALLNVLVWHRGGPSAGAFAGATVTKQANGQPITLVETLEYTWELYLPKLWFMHHSYFPGEYPLTSVWLHGAIGHFGWLDYEFPAWVYTLAKYLLIPLTLLALIGVVKLRRELKPLVPLFVCFAVMVLGLLGSIGYDGIRYRLTTGYPFEQARYLFPLLALYGLFVVFAAQGLGRRWAPAFAAGVVVLAMTHGLMAETLTISRYYG